MHTEQQQVESLKLWWRDQGKKVLVAFSVALVLWIGWQYWTHHQEVRRTKASEAFFIVMQAVEEDDYDTFQDSAHQLITEYKDLPYASLASLLWAHFSIEADNYKDAKSHLQWVIEHASSPMFADIARIRFARILIEEKSYGDARTALKKVKSPAYEGLRDEINGDSHVAEGDVPAARTSYEAALKSDSMIGGEGRRAFIEMKLNDLGAPLVSDKSS